MYHLNENKFTYLIYVLHSLIYIAEKGFPGGTVVKNLPDNAGDEREVSSVPGWGKSPGGGNGNHSSILAWKIPWTEEPGGYHPWSHKESDTTDQLSMHNVRN